MNVLSLFSGVGGLDLAAEMAGMTVVAQCEIDPYCQSVLRHHWPHVRLFDDIRELLCELKDSKQQAYEISPSPQARTVLRRSQAGVDAAAATSACVRQKRGKAWESTVQTNADIQISAETAGRMLVAARGCAERKTRTGKMAEEMKGEGGMEWQKLDSGGAACSQEIDTFASGVDTIKGSASTLITSNHGRNSQGCGSMSLTESLSAFHATDLSTCIDVIVGGVPCQPASCAGKRRGSADDRWLWNEAIELVRLIHPRFVVFENPCGILTVEGGVAFDNLLSDLEEAGYACQTFVIPACAVNAIHQRDRVFIIGHTEQDRLQTTADRLIRGTAQYDQGRETARAGTEDAADASQSDTERRDTYGGRQWGEEKSEGSISGDDDRQAIGGFRLLDDGVSERLVGYPSWAGGDWQEPPHLKDTEPGRVNKLKALGNAVVPQQVKPIFEAIMQYENCP